MATLAFTVFLGWLFVISGVLGLVTTFGRGRGGFWWSLLSAVLSVAVGVLMVFWPVNGTVSLTLVLAAFFVADGGPAEARSAASRGRSKPLSCGVPKSGDT